MNKTVLGIPVAMIILICNIVLLVYLGIFLSLLDTRRGINRLESDLNVVEDTQVQILKEVTATISATPTPTVKFRPTSTLSGEIK